ncbi:hypothetical protein VKT23_015626 [Stygiomarasmius scandens]|uniref:HNH nuclease domain-containing protein n=1 Tax=Marasmiellus scandens TaxID=2682957 RepID=A0ABR1IWZ7_9AGAR
MYALPTDVHELEQLIPQTLERREQVRSAYRLCLEAEGATNKPREKLNARIAGYLILYPLNETARHKIVVDVISGRSFATIYRIGDFYLKFLFCAFKKAKSSTPASSHRPSRPSFDMTAEALRETLKTAPQSHKDAKKQASEFFLFFTPPNLTKKWDDATVKENPESDLYMQLTRDPTKKVPTECAHIFGEYTNADIDTKANKCDYGANVWTVLTYFGHPEILEQLNGAKVHSLENVMTLEQTLHGWFDNLQVWFEETPVPNQYRLVFAHAMDKALYPEIVTFSQAPGFEHLPLPSPLYLKIQAACAKVAHLSGAADFIDQVYEDSEEMGVLASDGSSSTTLEYVLAGMTESKA